MSHQHDEPTTADPENSTDSAVKQSKRLTRQQKRFQLWRGVANITKQGKTTTKRKPSMPPLPWDPNK